MEWLLVAVGLGIIASASQLFRSSDPFATAGQSLGMKHSRALPDMLPRLSGTINGLPVRVAVLEKKPLTVKYDVYYPALGMSLRLERETTITRTLGSLGNPDREIGDRSFDDSFKVNTSRPDALQQLLTPELRSRLVTLIERYPAVVVADGETNLTSTYDSVTAETVANTVNDLVIVGVMLSANRPAPLETPPIRPVALQPDSEPQAPPAQPETRPEPPAATEPEQPAERSSIPPPSMPAPPPPPAPEPEAPPSTGLPEGFFEEVFGENRLSFESDERFEQEIRGASVRLSGAVRQSSHYEGKTDLNPSSGTKAVVTVAQIDNDLYGKTDIDAVVYLSGTHDFGRGERITFIGKVDGIDAFMRNLFVSEGSLTK